MSEQSNLIPLFTKDSRPISLDDRRTAKLREASKIVDFPPALDIKTPAKTVDQLNQETVLNQKNNLNQYIKQLDDEIRAINNLKLLFDRVEKQTEINPSSLRFLLKVGLPKILHGRQDDVDSVLGNLDQMQEGDLVNLYEQNKQGFLFYFGQLERKIKSKNALAERVSKVNQLLDLMLQSNNPAARVELQNKLSSLEARQDRENLIFQLISKGYSGSEVSDYKKLITMYCEDTNQRLNPEVVRSLNSFKDYLDGDKNRLFSKYRDLINKIYDYYTIKPNSSETTYQPLQEMETQAIYNARNFLDNKSLAYAEFDPEAPAYNQPTRPNYSVQV